MSQTNKIEKTPEDFVLEIQKACSKLDWHIAVKDNNGYFSGLIIGTMGYIKEVIAQLDEVEDYEIWSMPSTKDNSLH